MKFVPKRLNNTPSLIQIMDRRLTGTSRYLNQLWPCVLTRFCVTRLIELNRLLLSIHTLEQSDDVQLAQVGLEAMANCLCAQAVQSSVAHQFWGQSVITQQTNLKKELILYCIPRCGGGGWGGKIGIMVGCKKSNYASDTHIHENKKYEIVPLCRKPFILFEDKLIYTGIIHWRHILFHDTGMQWCFNSADGTSYRNISNARDQWLFFWSLINLYQVLATLL